MPTSRTATAPMLSAYQAVDGYRDAIRLGSARGLHRPGDLLPARLLAAGHAARPRTNGVDPLLVLALMRQESMFDPAARSPADARGLMQLLPSTAERVARRTGQPSPTGNLYDPDTNIALGVAHLQRAAAAATTAIRSRRWRPTTAAKAAVAKWQQRFGTLEPDEFVESITYRETRDYVKRVMGNYRRYQIEYADR